MIVLNNVSISIQDTVIFHQLNIQFESGTSYLLSGKNGVGKTTLLNMIAGIIQPKSGLVRYDFIDSTCNWDQRHELRKKNLHYVPTHALHELLQGPDVYYQQRYYTIEASPLPTVKDFFGERYSKLNEFDFPDSFNIHHLLHLELPRLSNGQFKKIIILKQLLDNLPRVLLLDYPFEGLDLISRMELKEFLDHLASHYHIQLIIADHDHAQLPQAITKKIELSISSRVLSAYTASELANSITILHSAFTPVKETEPVVEMRDLKIQYGKTVILKNLNWKINRVRGTQKRVEPLTGFFAFPTRNRAFIYRNCFIWNDFIFFNANHFAIPFASRTRAKRIVIVEQLRRWFNKNKTI